MKDKRPKPARGEAWGILNPWGDFWTYETFETKEAALAYVNRFWSGTQTDISEFTPVRAKITVSLAKSLPDPPRDEPIDGDRSREQLKAEQNKVEGEAT